MLKGACNEQRSRRRHCCADGGAGYAADGADRDASREATHGAQVVGVAVAVDAARAEAQ